MGWIDGKTRGVPNTVVLAVPLIVVGFGIAAVIMVASLAGKPRNPDAAITSASAAVATGADASLSPESITDDPRLYVPASLPGFKLSFVNRYPLVLPNAPNLPQTGNEVYFVSTDGTGFTVEVFVNKTAEALDNTPEMKRTKVSGHDAVRTWDSDAGEAFIEWRSGDWRFSVTVEKKGSMSAQAESIAGTLASAIARWADDAITGKLDAGTLAQRIDAFSAAVEKASAVRGPKPVLVWHECSPCRNYLQQTLNDPDSYEHVSSSEPAIDGDYWVVDMTFRAKNAFGAKVLSSQRFYIQRQIVVRAD